MSIFPTVSRLFRSSFLRKEVSSQKENRVEKWKTLFHNFPPLFSTFPFKWNLNYAQVILQTRKEPTGKNGTEMKEEEKNKLTGTEIKEMTRKFCIWRKKEEMESMQREIANGVENIFTRSSFYPRHSSNVIFSVKRKGNRKNMKVKRNSLEWKRMQKEAEVKE